MMRRGIRRDFVRIDPQRVGLGRHNQVLVYVDNVLAQGRKWFGYMWHTIQAVDVSPGRQGIKDALHKVRVRPSSMSVVGVLVACDEHAMPHGKETPWAKGER